MKRLWISLATALWGGTTMLAISIFQDFGPEMILPATCCAGLAGGSTASLMGRANPAIVLTAPVLTTVIGAALAGGFSGYPNDLGFGLIFGPMLVASAVLHDPVILCVWLAGAAGVHAVAKAVAVRH